MTYAQKIKNTLLNIKIDKSCCKKAFLYGLLLFSNTFDENEIRIYSENKLYTDTILTLFNQVFDIDFSNTIKIFPSSKDKKYRILCTDKKICTNILKGFFYSDTKKSYIFNPEIFQCDECKFLFLRGAFLSCGNIFSPKKAYHAEFVFSRFNLSRDMFRFMCKCTLDVKYTKRNNRYIVYTKESESIVDLLNLLGARDAAFDLIDTKIEKEIRNSCNRITNCETANMQKTIFSASNQIESIEKIIRNNTFDGLPLKLQETAKLRVEFPNLTIKELAEKHEIKITKSCVGHRLSKLCEIAKKL